MTMKEENKIILYQDDNEITRVSVRFADEDLWLTQNQLADIYQTTQQNIALHIKNIYADGELNDSTHKDFLLVRQEGNRQVQRNIVHYNLDMIISVGYRVNSIRGVQFRMWATSVLREYLIKGFAMNDALLKNAGGGNYFDELLSQNTEELLGKGNYAIGIDEAAFYGPKLDIQMRNVHGKEDTLVTIQIDMLLAKKFGMEYTDSNDERVTPYIIHRTSMGCYERTLALLLEKYAGALPMWIAPEQVRLLPIGDDQAEYANKLADRLEDEGIRVTVDARNEKIGYKIRAAQLEKVPFMLVIGEKEMNEASVAVRSRKTGDMGVMSADDFVAFAKAQVADKVLDN